MSNYKFIDDVVKVPKGNGGEILSVMISKENISSVTVICDYNIVGDGTEVTIKANNNHAVVEQRTFPNSNIFPKHIVRTRTHIIIYLETFRNED